MEITGETLDAVLYKLYNALEAKGHWHDGGSRGKSLELIGVAIRITHPRARISRSENRGKPFSALGELLWYLAGSDTLDFIQPYVREYKKDAVDGVLEGAYGPRLWSMRGQIDQFQSIETLLNGKPGSRRAVIQLFNAEDIATTHKEIPCTTTLQFHLRDKHLHMSVTLRSNDAYWGLPHDVFCFTMLQEMIARRLGVEIGEYYQYVGSMHVYEDYIADMREYLVEGIHQRIEMPAMPGGDPFAIIPQLLAIEARLRAGETVDANEVGDPYWADIVRLFQVFWAKELNEGEYASRVGKLREELVSRSYRPYVEGRLQLKARGAGSAAEDGGIQSGGNNVAV
jgi:thymidylate synthase